VTTNEESVATTARAGLLAALAAFGIIYAVGLAFVLMSPIRNEALRIVLDAARGPLHDPTVSSVLIALAGVVGYLAVIILQPLIIIGAFMAVEIWLAGPPKSWPATFLSLFFRSVITVLATAIGVISGKLLAMADFRPLLHLEPVTGNPFVALITTTGVILLAMVVNDFATYWAHRFQHRVKFLWRFHRVHHAIENLDAANSYDHPVDGIVAIICTTLVGLLLGFTYDQFLIISAVVAIHVYFVHTRAPIHLGPLRQWIADNRFHHFHHSRRYEHYNRNFSEYFTIWDRVFGTCYVPADDEMVETGVLGTKQARNLWEYLTGSLESTGEDMLPPGDASPQATEKPSS